MLEFEFIGCLPFFSVSAGFAGWTLHGQILASSFLVISVLYEEDSEWPEMEGGSLPSMMQF